MVDDTEFEVMDADHEERLADGSLCEEEQYVTFSQRIRNQMNARLAATQHDPEDQNLEEMEIEHEDLDATTTVDCTDEDYLEDLENDYWL